MTEPFYPVSKPSITAGEEAYVLDAVRSGWISSQGKYVTEFERRFAAYCGAAHGISVCNGTVAIHLALRALGIGPGDEVIVPDLSFIATANAVVMAGAKPVFCDIDPFTLCIDHNLLEPLITPRTRAIMPVHLYGHPADMRAITEIAQRFGLKVIEDAAEAHGACVDGKRVGGLGDCATFSFYGNKNLTTGEGGMITTQDDDLAERCRRLRDHAMSSSRRYWHDELGYNYRMTNLQAALGCAQLDRIDDLLQARHDVFEWYKEALLGLNQVQLNRTAPWAHNAHWLVCAEVDGFNADLRDDLLLALKKRGVDSRPYFYSMSDMPYFETANTPVSHSVSAKGLSLPTYVGLTNADVRAIAERFTEALAVAGKAL